MTNSVVVNTHEELAEVLKNLGIEYRFSCYHEKNHEGCHLLGDFLENIQGDFKRAAKVYGDNCEKNKYGKSCNRHGEYLFLGRGREQNIKKAIEMWKLGCEVGCPEACFHSGQALLGQDPRVKPYVERDVAKALEHLDKACSGNVSKACFEASAQHLFGKNGNPVNEEKAFEYAQKGCDLDDLYSCINLAQMYSKGTGIKKDDEKAEFYKQKVLDMKETLLSSQGLEMGQGTDTRSFFERIKSWFGSS